MLIRSQNKAAIVNLDNVFNIATIRNINGAVAIYIGSQGSCCNMAEYSTKAKAMKVLDMIQEAYMDYKSGEIIGSGLAGSAYTGSYDTKESVAHGIAVLKGYGNEIRKSILFQMPEDSEVEV